MKIYYHIINTIYTLVNEKNKSTTKRKKKFSGRWKNLKGILFASFLLMVRKEIMKEEKVPQKVEIRQGWKKI